MGIRGLFKLLKDKCKKGYYEEVPITHFTNARMAVDATGWSCVLMAAIQSGAVDSTHLSTDDLDVKDIFRRWAQLVIDSVTHWLNANITPVFIFDGGARPEKEILRKERVEGRLRVIKDIKELHDEINSNDNLFDDAELQEKEKKLGNLYKQSWRLGKEHLEFLRELIKCLGLPHLDAKHDAEQLGALLVRDGYCNVVYTEDSDALPFGAKLQIRKIKNFIFDGNGRRVNSCMVVNLQEILSELQLSEEEFTDVCILGGCDYNCRIEGIAVTRAFNIIRDYRKIENLPVLPTPRLISKCLSSQLANVLFLAGYGGNNLLDFHCTQNGSISTSSGTFQKFPGMILELNLQKDLIVEIYWTGIENYNITLCVFGREGIPERKGNYLIPIKQLRKEAVYDLAVLNYQKCREIFAPSHSLDNATAGKQTCTEYSFDNLMSLISAQGFHLGIQNLNIARVGFQGIG